MLKTAKHDLDESRRRLRTLMTGIAGSYIILITRWASACTASLGDPQFAPDLLSLMLLIAIKLLTLIRVQGQDNPIARIFNRRPLRRCPAWRLPTKTVQAILMMRKPKPPRKKAWRWDWWN